MLHQGNNYLTDCRTPVDLASLILTIKHYLQFKSPREIFIPYFMADLAQKGLTFILRFIKKIGIKADLPPELIFLDNFYKSQTLSVSRLEASSFVDPIPEETVYTRSPELVNYYLPRWNHENLITTHGEDLDSKESVIKDFQHDPMKLLKAVHSNNIAPFQELVGKTDK